MVSNTRVVLSRRPDGLATPDHFAIETQELGALEPGNVRIEVEYLSVDPALRTMLHGEGFHQHVGIGQVIATRGVGRIVESAADGWAVGELVRGRIGAQSLATVDPLVLERIDGQASPSSVYLGTLGGSSGVTAWVGIRKIGRPAAGDTVVVSGAAGAVGSIAGQIAKIDGARVIGIAGGREKVAYLTDVAGFDAAIDYKHDDVHERLRELAPDGIDVFFDNVGGQILDAVLDNLAMRARVVICGAISQYDNMDQISGPSLYLRLAERQSRMEGFAYFHFPECRDEAIADLAAWLESGAIVNAEHVLDGIDQFPRGLEFMFNGGNIGKLVVKV